MVVSTDEGTGGAGEEATGATGVSGTRRNASSISASVRPFCCRNETFDALALLRTCNLGRSAGEMGRRWSRGSQDHGTMAACSESNTHLGVRKERHCVLDLILAKLGRCSIRNGLLPGSIF